MLSVLENWGEKMQLDVKQTFRLKDQNTLKKSAIFKKKLKGFGRKCAPIFYLLLLLGLLFINPVITLVPLVFAANLAIETTNPPGKTTQKAIPIILSIQYGKGGGVQEYPINSGESIFVPASEPNNPTINANPQEAKESDAYRQQVGQISDQIAKKISAIQKKQQDLNNEVYPVYKTPLQIEVYNLQSDLQTLQSRRDQISSQRTSKESAKPTIPPTPPTTVASGFTVKPVVAGARVSIIVQTQGKNPIQTTIESGFDNWVQIFAAEKGQSQDIWAKVGAAQ